MAEENLGTAVLKIVVNDDEARSALNLLKRDVQATTQQATKARRTTGRAGTDPDEAARKKAERAADQAANKRVSIQNRLNLLEAKGVDVTAFRLRAARANEAAEKSQFDTARRINAQLGRALSIEENRLRVSAAQNAQLKRQEAATKTVATAEKRRAEKPTGVGFATTPEQILASRGGTQKGAATGINAFESTIDRATRLRNRLNILDAKGADTVKLRGTYEQAVASLNQGELATSQRLLQNLSRQVSIKENDLKVTKLREAATKKEQKQAAAAAAPAAPGAPPAQTRADRRAAEQLASRNRDIASNALIGGAFPLLFGQGIGASAGGALGGAAGGALGGQFGFGLSLIGTAVGAQFDALLEKGNTLASALSDPIGKFTQLTEAGLLSSRAVERSAEALIALGANATAAATIQRDLEVQYGKSAVSAAQFFRQQEDIANRSNRQTDVTLGPFFNFVGAEVQRAGRRITEPGFGIFPSAEERNRPVLQQKAEQDRANVLNNINKIEQQRLATQGLQLRSITAQAQGYDAAAAALDQQVKAEQNALDIADARRRLSEVGPGPNKLAQQAAIQKEINRLANEGARDQQAFADKQKNDQKNLLAQRNLDTSLNRLKLQSIQEQVAGTQALASAERGVARDTLATTQAIQESINQARRREQEIGAQIDAARLRGGDANEQEAERLVGLQQLAAVETGQALVQGAFALQQAGEKLIQDAKNARDALRSAREGAFDLLRRGDQLDLLRQARSDIASAGVFDPNKVARLSERDLISAAGSARSIVEAEKNLRDIETATVGLTEVNRNLQNQLTSYGLAVENLAGVTKTLAEKNWAVNVTVAGAQSAAYGDVVNGAISP